MGKFLPICGQFANFRGDYFSGVLGGVGGQMVALSPQPGRADSREDERSFMGKTA
jgi:hypothetical protein